jgi:carboxyl-terminal processing protease
MTFRGVAIAVLGALVALAAGLWLGGHPESLPGPVRDAFVEDDRAVRAELIESIEDNFYKPVDEDTLRDASLKAVVRSLGDRFSRSRSRASSTASA